MSHHKKRLFSKVTMKLHSISSRSMQRDNMGWRQSLTHSIKRDGHSVTVLAFRAPYGVMMCAVSLPTGRSTEDLLWIKAAKTVELMKLITSKKYLFAPSEPYFRWSLFVKSRKSDNNV